MPEDAGQASVQFKVRTPNHLATTGTPTVSYTLTPGTATATDDYTPVSGSFIVPNDTADQALLSVPVANIVDDAFGEPVETFTATFDPPAGIVLSRTSHTVSITNDAITPDPVGVSIQDLTLTEGNTTTNAQVIVQLGYPADQVVTMDFATANGTALAGIDYTATASPPRPAELQGRREQQDHHVPILGDTCPDPSRAFVVNLSNVSASGILVDDQATVTINDNDLAGTFQLSTPRLVVSESAVSAKVTVTRTGGLAGGPANCVGFSLATQNGSAVSGLPPPPTRLQRHRSRPTSSSRPASPPAWWTCPSPTTPRTSPRSRSW